MANGVVARVATKDATRDSHRPWTLFWMILTHAGTLSSLISGLIVSARANKAAVAVNDIWKPG